MAAQNLDHWRSKSLEEVKAGSNTTNKERKKQRKCTYFTQHGGQFLTLKIMRVFHFLFGLSSNTSVFWSGQWSQKIHKIVVCFIMLPISWANGLSIYLICLDPRINQPNKHTLKPVLTMTYMHLEIDEMCINTV